MKVNNLVKDPKWKKIISCTCHGKELDLCLHCRYSRAEQSIPTENFKVNDDIRDKNGKVTKKQTRTINEITLKIGSRDDVIGWEWN